MPLAQLQSWAYLRPQPAHAKTAGTNTGPAIAGEFVHPTDALIAGHTHWREPGTGRILPPPTARNAQGRPLASQTIAANDAEGAEGAEGGVRIRHYHCDQIGTPRELTRPTGEITWQATYKAWGNTQTVQWEVAVSAAQDQTTFDVEYDRVDRSGQQPLRFQGQYFDEETGLHYNRFRYYDPDSGRFISHDPIGLLGGENTFGYVPNPSGWVDPFGLIKGGYNGPKPKYVNKGQHQPGNPNYRGGGSKTSTLPCHHAKLAAKAVPDKLGKHWYAIDDKGVVHRFGNGNDGTMHWNGDSASARGLEVPSDVVTTQHPPPFGKPLKINNLRNISNLENPKFNGFCQNLLNFWAFFQGNRS